MALIKQSLSTLGKTKAAKIFSEPASSRGIPSGLSVRLKRLNKSSLFIKPNLEW